MGGISSTVGEGWISAVGMVVGMTLSVGTAVFEGKISDSVVGCGRVVDCDMAVDVAAANGSSTSVAAGKGSCSAGVGSP